MTVDMPADLQSWVDARLAGGEYIDAGDYLRDLIRRDVDETTRRDTLRAMIAEGWASGIVDRDTSDVIAEIIDEDPDLHG